MKKFLHRLLKTLNDTLSKLTKEELLEITAVAGCYIVMEILGITCPILFITGISCAGCGMSRAWLSLLRLNISNAFYYHPLFWFPALTVFVFLFKRKILKEWCLAGVILFLAVYGGRMISGRDKIVVFRPEEGALFRSIAGIIQILK